MQFLTNSVLQLDFKRVPNISINISNKSESTIQINIHIF